MRTSWNASLCSLLLCASTCLVSRDAFAFTADAALPDSPVSNAASLSANDLREATTADALPDAPTPTAVYPEDAERTMVQRETTWKSIVPDILHDQKDIWLSPAQLAHGHGWVPTLAIAAGTAGFIVADPHIMPYFRDRQGSLNGYNTAFNQWATMGYIAAVPVGLMVAGTARHDSYEKTTALLAARGYADTEVLEFAAKLVARRIRPSDVPAGQSYNHTFFKSKLISGNGSSFPSGHAAGAFCVATVISARYKSHKWVPWAMYSLATAISFSRVTTLGHFPSDVFLGAGMGYAVSKLEVLRPR